MKPIFTLAVAVAAVAALGGGVLAVNAGNNATRQQLTHQVAVLQRQLHAENTELASLAALASKATSAHLGVCWSWMMDDSTGDVYSVDLESPSNQGGVPSCPYGSFISVVPGG